MIWRGAPPRKKQSLRHEGKWFEKKKGSENLKKLDILKGAPPGKKAYFLGD